MLAQLDLDNKMSMRKIYKIYNINGAKFEKNTLEQEWRPKVSNSKKVPEGAMAYWSLGREGPEDWYPAGMPTWRTYRNRYDKGWCGLTLNDTSDFEERKINAFISNLPKKNILIYKSGIYNSSLTMSDIVYPTYCLCYWFKNLDDHNKFVELLETFPIRTQLFKVTQDKVPEIKKLLRGKNYKAIKSVYDSDLVVAISAVDDNKTVLAKLYGA